MVIPEEIRDTLGLNEGDQFVVIGEGDDMTLNAITPPKVDEFRGLLSQARAEAKRAGVKKADLKTAIARVAAYVVSGDAALLSLKHQARTGPC